MLPLPACSTIRLSMVLGALFCACPTTPMAAQDSTIRFTTEEGTWMSIDASPDGRTLVFELLGDIYTLPVAGGKAERLLWGPAFQSQPRFSPDGTRLTFISDATGSDNLWIANSDGSSPRPITEVTGETLLSPAWSADGRSVFVTRIAGSFQRGANLWRYDPATNQGEIVVENANGRSAPLVSSPAPGPYGARPSPDGSSVYYTAVTPRPYGSREGARSDVQRLDLATGQSFPVRLGGVNPMKPGISPDGEHLVFAAMRDGRTALRVRALATGEERWLVDPLQRHQLEGRATRDVLPDYAFSPDGAFVYIEIGGRIRRVTLSDGDVSTIPFAADVDLAVSPTLDSPRRIEAGPVRARSVQQLAAGPGGTAAYSALARIWIDPGTGGAPRRLTDTERPREFMPAWSPDGAWVAFVTWEEAGGHLWKGGPHGAGAPVRLSDEPAIWADPAWSPDGSELVALRAPLARPAPGPGGLSLPDARIVRVPAEGGSHRDVAPATGARGPHFGERTDLVWFTSAAGLEFIDLASGVRDVAARLPARTPAGRWSVSPDGRSVAHVGQGGVRRLPVPAQGWTGQEVDLGAAALGAASHASWARDGSLHWISDLSWSTQPTPTDAPAVQPLTVEAPRSTPEGTVVLRGATALTMRGDEVVERADIVVSGNRIHAIGPAGSVDIPAGAPVFDLTGKTVVPGFVDVHAHFGASAELLEPETTATFANLAFGITTVRNPQASPDVFALADVVAADRVPSPRIFSTGPGLFQGLDLQSLEQTRQVLRRYRDVYGTHLLKSYLVGDRQQRQWVVQASRELGMMPTTEGGADTKANLTHAIDGFSGNEHAFPIAPLYDDVVQLVARTGMTYTPTLVVSFGAALPIYRMLAEERPHRNPRAARWHAEGELYARSSERILWFSDEAYGYGDVGLGARAILEAGGRVALGGHGEVQGLSNHWEMKLLAESGMDEHDVLRVATLFGAEALGYGQDLGSLEVGKLADLVVLNRDPRSDIEATQDIAWVMHDGVLREGASLDEAWPNPSGVVRPWWMERSSTPAAAVTAAQELIRTTIEEGRIPGTAVAVIQDGEVRLAEGFGTANLETGTGVTTETMFQAGSLAKQFTAAGVLALVEAGRMSLDDPIRRYLPEVPDAWQPITIRHLLTHSSGIPDYTSDAFDYGTNYSEDDLVRMASDLPLEFTAGERWNYSNTGYVMLGVAISRVTEMHYWAFLRERIFDPAGMPTIRVNTESDIVPHRARGYLPVPGGWQNAGYVAPETNTTADGSMLMSVRDLIAWEAAVRTRAGSVLSPESWELMETPMTLNSGRSHPYGFAWFFHDLGGERMLEHSGAWQGFVAQFTRFPDADLSVAILTNGRSPASGPLAIELASLFEPRISAVPPATTPIADPDPAATEYVRGMLEKAARGELELSDFAFVRQTIFPRMRAALTGVLSGLGSPDRMELLSRAEVGDDRALEYFAWFGDRRFRVAVSLGPDGGLTALRVTPSPVSTRSESGPTPPGA